MTTLTRYKLACGLFAAVAAVAVVRGHQGPRNTPAQPAATSARSQLPLALRRPIHVAPEAIGVTQQELVDRILAARSVKDVQLLADKRAKGPAKKKAPARRTAAKKK